MFISKLFQRYSQKFKQSIGSGNDYQSYVLEFLLVLLLILLVVLGIGWM